MKIYEAIMLLESKANILKSSEGDLFQRYNEDLIMVTYCQEKRIEGSVAGTIKNNEFIKKYLDMDFEQELQWFQKEDFVLPRLCKVTTSAWPNAEKIVMLNCFNGTMFNTGFGESYTPSYQTKIIPLSNEEIEDLKV